MFKRNRKHRNQPLGCTFLLGTGFVILVLFVLNHFIVRALFSVQVTEVDERLIQATQFALPIGMLLAQLVIFDRLVAWLRKMRSG